MGVPCAPMSPRRRHLALVCLAFVAFVSLGLPDGVLGVAWPSVRHGFGLPVSRLGLLLVCGTAGYLTVSTLSGPITRRIGVGRLLVGSTGLAGLGLAGLGLSPSWGWLLPSMFLGGLGAGGIDAGLNAFAAERFSARMMSWLHACYGIGATLGPLLITAVLVFGHSWRWGYAVLALGMAVLACFFMVTVGLWTRRTDEEHAPEPVRAPLRATLGLPLAWMHIGVFWFYCGLEVCAGQLVYTLFTEGRGVRPEVAGPVVAGYWASLTVGRIVFGQLAAGWSRDRILRVGTLAAPVAVVLIWLDVSDPVSFGGLWLLGFALAPIFPMMVSATPERLGREHSPNAVGLQMSAASLGVAILPGLGAVVMRRMGLEAIGGFMLGLSLAVLVLQETAMPAARRRADAQLAELKREGLI